MKRQRSCGDDLDSGGEKSGCKEWGRRDQEGNKVRSSKNLDSESSDRSSYRRSYPSKLEGGRGEDRDVRAERKGLSVEAYRWKEHSDYRPERKGFSWVESVRKPFRDSIGERSHRSSSNGFPLSSSTSFRREFYDPLPKAKGFRSKRDDSAWRRSSSREGMEEDPVAHSLPRVASLGSRGIRAGSEDGGSGPPVSPVESRKVDNGYNSGSEMEEGELEPDPEMDVGVSESEAGKESEVQNGEPNPEKDYAPDITKEEDREVTKEDKFGSSTEQEKLEVTTTAAVEGDHESSDATAQKSEEHDRTLDQVDERGDKSGGGGISVDSNGREELKETDGSFPRGDDEHVSKANADEACGLTNQTDGNASLLQDLNELADDEESTLDANLTENDEGSDKNGNRPKQSATLIPENLDSSLPSDAAKVAMEKVGGSFGTIEKVLDGECNESAKDKGKRVVISNEENLGATDELMERDLLRSGLGAQSIAGENSDSSSFRDGMSMMGFELFSRTNFGEKLDNMGSSVEKHHNKKPKSEPLQLSLGLPDVSLSLVSSNPKPALPPSSPSRARSAHSLPANSFYTFNSSDGFTASISLSCSQQIVHNPSCSLTQNSQDNYEHSVGSHPIFQSVDQINQGSWQGQSSAEPVYCGSGGITERYRQRKEVPLYQRLLQNGNGAFQGFNSRERSAFEVVNGNAHFHEKRAASRGQHPVTAVDGSAGKSDRLARQTSFTRELGAHARQEVVSSPTHSVGSRETRSEHNKKVHKDVRWLDSDRRVPNKSGQSETEQLAQSATRSAEKLIFDILSEPVATMAGRLQEMPEQSLMYLKENARQMIINGNMHKHLSALQEMLQRRTDLTMDTLSKSHRVQLEIMVAVKTGLQAFLRRINHVSSSDLVDFFLNLKCRNLACRSYLPVDDCDCKICSQKNGFCSACMCLVCSKFDMASNTCSWVGCDVCLHWCHTDCGLRDSHIRNGHSVTGATGTTEMQFHCVACGHPSEMFGFVKEVFKTCAKDWNAETLSKELGYVRRIFHGSEDARGRQLHDVADQVLAHLENKGNVLDVSNILMTFLAEGESTTGNTSSAFVAKEHLITDPGKASNGVATLRKEPSFKASSVSSERASRSEPAGKLLVNVDMQQMAKQADSCRLQLPADKKGAVDELETIVRLKEAEAEMFQTRADDARREAEGLRRIVIAKCEKIEEEYTSRIAKLHLAEAEHKRQQKLEELQAIERAHQDYFNMKLRMEADIKDLLLKMEATKQNLLT